MALQQGWHTVVEERRALCEVDKAEGVVHSRLKTTHTRGGDI